MLRRKIVGTNQKVTSGDFTDFGLFPEGTFDAIGEGLLIPDQAFWGFATTNQGTTLEVGEGHYINAGQVYYNTDEGGVTFDLLSKLPTVTRKIVTLTVWGQELDAAEEPRTFVIDPVTRETEARVTSTEKIRRAELSLVSGVEAPDPEAPALANNVLGVADILLDTSGVVSITMYEENRAPNLRTLNTALAAIQIWKALFQARLDTLASDLAVLAGRIKGLANRADLVRVMQDLAQAKDRVGLPDDYTAWASDHFLDNSNSDTAFPDWLALVEDGCRFPHAAERSDQIGLLNPIDPNVIVSNYFMLPQYTLVARTSNVGNDAEVSISSYQYQNWTWTQLSRTRERVRYGTIFTVCTNSAWWQTGHYNAASGIFYKAGDTFQVLDPQNATVNHKAVRLQQFWHDIWTEYYWDWIVSTDSASGATVSESMLNSQEGWLMAVDLYFTRKAATGNVKVLICETNEAGAPDLDRVISTADLLPANISIYPTATRVLLPPTACKAGKRYACVLISGGNHYLASTTGNKYTSGSMFTSTDGAWFLGDLQKDLAMQWVFARFASPRVEVQMNPMQLENGIGAIDILAQAAVPEGDGFGIIHMVQLNGVWTALNDAQPNALVGLPAMLPYKVVFLGTTEMMPGLGVGSNSRVLTWRPRADFTHVSEIRDMPGSSTVDTVSVRLRLEHWRGGAHHTCTITLLHGVDYTSQLAADTVSDEACEDDPFVEGGTGALYRTATFDLSALSPPDLGLYRIQIEGTTDSVTACFHVAERVDVGINATP